MSNDILFNLPPVLYAFAAAWFPLVMAGLASISKQVARIPGFRPADDSRTILMRVLVFVLNGAGLLGFAWQQNLALDKSMLLAFLICAAGQTLGSHVAYVGAKNGSNAGSGNGNSSASATAVSDPALTAALAQAAAAAQAAEAALQGSK